MLANGDKPLSPASLYHLSDLDRKQAAELEAVWPDLGPLRRLALIQQMTELAEANVELNIEVVGRVGLEDEDPLVRAAAVASLWECESPDLLGIFFNLLTRDREAVVRAAAASALGRYVYQAEVEELDARQARRLEQGLLAAATGEDEVDVRRRAIEALGYSSRSEVEALIQSAYASPEEKLRVSAVLAMGRSADRRWRDPVLAELDSPSPALRFEAVRAAGELELREAAPALIEASQDVDPEVRYSAIWALGQVGGSRARQALEGLLQQADEEEAAHIQDTLDNLDFMESLEDFGLPELSESRSAALRGL